MKTIYNMAILVDVFLAIILGYYAYELMFVPSYVEQIIRVNE